MRNSYGSCLKLCGWLSKVATNQGNDVQLLFFCVCRWSRGIFLALRIRRVAPKQLAGTQMKMTNVLNFLAYFSALQGARNQEQPAPPVVVAPLETRLPQLSSSHVLYANKVLCAPQGAGEQRRHSAVTTWLGHFLAFW